MSEPVVIKVPSLGAVNATNPSTIATGSAEVSIALNEAARFGVMNDQTRILAMARTELDRALALSRSGVLGLATDAVTTARALVRACGSEISGTPRQQPKAPDLAALAADVAHISGRLTKVEDSVSILPTLVRETVISLDGDETDVEGAIAMHDIAIQALEVAVYGEAATKIERSTGRIIERKLMPAGKVTP